MFLTTSKKAIARNFLVAVQKWRHVKNLDNFWSSHGILSHGVPTSFPQFASYPQGAMDNDGAIIWGSELYTRKNEQV